MKSHPDPEFVELFRHLPKAIQQLTRAKYHPSLHFKKAGGAEPIYSVRINPDNRALGFVEADRIDWFWIGQYDEYDKLLS